ncbi:RNA-binding NOB1-like protein [Primulina huaijiensis]|uniref:RNA-binding NOB1-like protein n=1 Tax=Primulina huaijiensis TaxID=1492673 RepID=UPI003CC6E335
MLPPSLLHTSTTTMEVPPQPAAPPCWSNILKMQPEKLQHSSRLDLQSADANNLQNGVLVGSCKSSKGIAVAVVDANALIRGEERLSHAADRFVSVADVIDEIRDPSSRHFLNFLPFTVDTLEPSPEALKKVINFARATGDLQTLSDVDLKLIALTYTLEVQIHGTHHLRDTPPPIQTVNVKRLPEKDLPGWGSNVPNIEEWEALEREFDSVSNLDSKILPVKDLNLELNSDDQLSIKNVPSQDGSVSHFESLEVGDDGVRKPRRYFPPKKIEVKIEGKKTVVDGIDASQGQFDDNSGDWRPAVSRSTHRRYLRRKSRREIDSEIPELRDSLDTSSNVENENLDDSECPELLMDESYEQGTDCNSKDVKVRNKNNGDEDISIYFNKMKLEEESLTSFQDGHELHSPSEGVGSKSIKLTDAAQEDVSINDEELQNLEIRSQISEMADTSHTDDISSEQSWTLRSLSESSVACITSDFAMQNVLLQMGLRLLAPGGIQIRELHRWVLKCHACFKVTTDIGRIFCPKCGNGGTLRKVAVTVNENGIVLAGRRPRISLRGTKFSLPLPQGGRDAVTKNPVLREDQLPQKFLHPKIKKKNKQDDDFIVPDDVFRHHTYKKAPLQPPVRKALAVFAGKRNPNDNHFSRPKC